MDFDQDRKNFADGYVPCEYCGRELTPEEIEDNETVCDNCKPTDEAIKGE